jgi:hypothetical protein
VRLHQLTNEGRIAEHDVVAPQHHEWLIADHFLCQQHGMPVAQGRALADHDELGHLGGPPCRFEQVVLACRFEAVLQLEEAVEVVLDGALGRGGDQHHLLDARLDGALDDVLDHWLVDDRQHLFRHRLGGRQEARTETRGRDYRFSDTFHELRTPFPLDISSAPAASTGVISTETSSCPGNSSCSRATRSS